MKRKNINVGETRVNRVAEFRSVVDTFIITQNPSWRSNTGKFLGHEIFLFGPPRGEGDDPKRVWRIVAKELTRVSISEANFPRDEETARISTRKSTEKKKYICCTREKPERSLMEKKHDEQTERERDGESHSGVC